MFLDFYNMSACVRGFLASELSTCDDISFDSLVGFVRDHPVCQTLMPHQVDAVTFMLSRDGGILADDMGLGKTCCSIIRCLIQPEASLPCLIITPAGLRRTWRDEILRICPTATIEMPDSGDDLDGTRLPQFTIIPFSRLKSFYQWNALPSFKVLFVDESQAFKNNRSFTRNESREAAATHARGDSVKGHRTALMFEIAKPIPSIYCLTGTPILSRPRELFNLLKLIRHPLGNSFLRFSKQFCGGVETRFGWQADGCTNAVELRESLKNVVLRRLKVDVLNLPGKETILTRTPLAGEWIAKYRGAWHSYITNLKSTKSKADQRKAFKARHIVSLNLLRQICSQSKTDYIVDRIINSDEKMIVFTSVTETLTSISEALTAKGVDHVCYHGAMNESKRHAAVKHFRGEPACRVFLSNTEAGKTGLTLIEATRVIFMDMVWTPADHYQAEDRAHRIGQTRKVTCEYLIAPGTVEDVIYELLASKKKVIDKILGGRAEDDGGVMGATIEGDFLTKIISLAKSPEAEQLQIF